MSDTNLSDHPPSNQTSVLKQMSFASRSMPTIPALTFSTANCPTYEDQNQSPRMSQSNFAGLETDKKTIKKSKMNQFFKTMRPSKVTDDGKQPTDLPTESLSIDL
ncbi:unnamed protein product [Staurois parvus]|uniref:Uncharacterized protein n=1 Tax=Staurois parvus TaxID=386267 RepID=A0ABN9EA52_9NEOB|nr:unnamed protein product [Staurois parvus]